MPDRSRQKERKRLKRKRKQQEHRRAASISPLQAISRVPGEVQCWMNTNWGVTRQASIWVLRQTRSGRCAMAAFLVDFGMAGLKDAWGRIDITSAEFFDDVLDPMRERVPVAEVSVDEARRFIAGGLRFAHDNGFRLPHRYDRWLSVLGDIGDWREADVSDFDMEFAGSMDDLRKRLIGQSVEDFLAREDVTIVLSDAAPSLIDDNSLEFEDAQDDLADVAVECVREWCTAGGESPSPFIGRAWDSYSDVIMELLNRVDSPEGLDKSVLSAQVAELVADQVLLEPARDRAEILRAFDQVARFAAEDKDNIKRLLAMPDME
jgi:hypothetical protein